MAENEAEGAASDAAAAGAPKNKLKLIIIAIAVLAILGGGAATWFFFRHGDDEHHAEAAPPSKPPAFVDVPDMMVNLAGAPGERVQYLRLKIVLELKEELTKRVNAAVAPIQVSAVLFKEVVVQ